MITIKLCVFAHQPSFKDSALQPAEKKRELQEISLFLKQHQTDLTSDSLPELYFLKDRIKRLNELDSRLVATIDRLISRFQTAALSKEDDLAVKMSCCAISKGFFLPLYVQLYRLKSPHIMSKLEQHKPAHMDDATLLQTARVCELLEKFEMEIKFDEFLKLLDKQGLDICKLQKMKPGFPPYPLEVEHFIRSFLPDAPRSFEDAKSQLLSNLQTDLSENRRSLIPVTLKAQQPVNITRLAIAVLIGDEQYVKHFLQAGVSTHESDSQGYTAAHFAAMVSSLQVLFQLYQYGAKLDAKTHEGATVYDFLRARGLAKVYDTRLVQTECGLMTANRDSLYTPGALLGLWASCIQEDESSHPLVTKKVVSDYTEMKEGKKPYISPLGIRRLPNGHILSGQWEGYALRTIEAGDIVDEYTGEVQCTSLLLSQDTTYASQLTGSIAINAKEQGSFAKYINHGPPNCIWKTVVYRGLVRKVVVTLRKVEKGETLYISYGSDYFRKGARKFQELAPSIVEKFIRETAGLTSFDYGLQSHENEWLKSRAIIERRSLVVYAEPIEACHEEALLSGILIGMHTYNMLFYLLEFPEYLIELVKQNKLEKQRLINLFEALGKLPSYAEAIAKSKALMQTL